MVSPLVIIALKRSTMLCHNIEMGLPGPEIAKQAAELIRQGKSGMTTPLLIMVVTAISGTLATVVAGVIVYFITRR
jgi:hypothetical protein